MDETQGPKIEVKFLTTDPDKARLKSDDEIIVRMLNYCDDEPRLESEIRVYSGLDRSQFVKFVIHCIKRGLLKVEMTEDKQYFVTTQRGKQVLATAETIRDTLGITPEQGA